MIVREGQSLRDICLQEYGSLDGLGDLIERNPAITSVDFEPEVGTELQIGEPINKRLVDYLAAREIKLVTNYQFPEEGEDNGIFSEEFNELFG
jgi:hypothetical protein